MYWCIATQYLGARDGGRIEDDPEYPYTKTFGWPSVERRRSGLRAKCKRRNQLLTLTIRRTNNTYFEMRRTFANAALETDGAVSQKLGKC